MPADARGSTRLLITLCLEEAEWSIPLRTACGNNHTKLYQRTLSPSMYGRRTLNETRERMCLCCG